MRDLKQKSIRGGLARSCAQAVSLLLRVGSLMVLARVLEPRDFGFVNMVTALTGVLTWFRDFGLSSAVIQRSTITEEQICTLFWINIVVGGVLGLVVVATAPAIAAFYSEPQLFGVTAVLGTAFLFNGAGIQHSALLQRQMRFTALAVISVASLIVGNTIGICGAIGGYGYWALVAMSVTVPLTATIGFWIVTGWVPGMPRRRAGIRSMIHFGGTVTLNGLVAYIAFNAEKIMIGRLWGAEAIGLYGRAYQLVSIPTDNLNCAIGEVAFAALSRLQDDPVRQKSYFLKGLSLFFGLTLPITMICALYADDVVVVFLGPKWIETAATVRFLAPTIAIFAIINPLGWLIYSIGLVGRGLRIALAVAPLMIAAYAVGLRHGPNGVAFAYSAAMALWAIPVILWCVNGTAISFRDILAAVSGPLTSAIPAGALAFGVRLICGPSVPSLPRLALGSVILLITFFGVLLCAEKQKSLYLDLLRGLRIPFSAAHKIAA
jgi:O-antigen/teichoic acid export membrane protein